MFYNWNYPAPKGVCMILSKLPFLLNAQQSIKMKKVS